MHTELGMIQGARIQYRNYYRTMAIGGRWHVYRAPVGETLSGVIVAPVGDMPPGSDILVSDVQAMTEQTMVNALSAAIRRTGV
jgi:hypothetical protein